MATAPPSATAANDGTAGPSAAAPDGGTPAPRSNPASKPGSPRSKSAAPPAIPHRDKDSINKVMVERFVTRDWVHSAALKDAQDRMVKDTRERRLAVSDYKSLGEPGQRIPSHLFGAGYSGYGNGVTEAGGPGVKLLYPTQKHIGRRTTPALRHYSKKDMKKQAEQHEELVPIRIDVDYDKVKLRDTFTFNLHERLIPVEHVAQQLVEDMGLKPPLAQPVLDQVINQIQEQLMDFYPFAYSEEEPLDPELPYHAYKNDEMRILVKLHITVGAHTLIDQFEWDINNPMNSPEEFAASMAQDLSLSGEFTTAIAHCIREQSQTFTRSLYSIGHPFDGRPVEEPDLVSAFLPSPIPSIFRPQQQAKDYSPYLYENTEAELEKSETMFSREQRRQKRSVNRRGGPVLPDLKERQRTVRTSIVSSVLPGAVPDIEETRLFKRAVGAGGLSGRGKRNLSDSDDSDDSMPDSPATSQQQGTARTRGMRGAANAAVQRMANIGRSETPEATIHHHETRTSRRFGREATREDTEEPSQTVLTFRVTPARLRQLMRDLRARRITPGPPTRAGSVMGPPITPAASNTPLPRSATPSVTPVPAPHQQQPPAEPSKPPLPEGGVPFAPGQTDRPPVPPPFSLSGPGPLPPPSGSPP